MMIYARSGDNSFICIQHKGQEKYIPDGYIKMTEINPNPLKLIASEDGSWIDPETYSKKRKDAILDKWPIDKQLEAITDYLSNNSKPEKLNALLEFLTSVKKDIPKPN